MTTMVVEVYDALRAINVPDEKAKAAAQALSQDMTRGIGWLRGEVAALRRDMDAGFGAADKETGSEFRSVRGELSVFRKETEAGFRSVRTDIAGLKADVAVLRWMMGSVFAVLIAVAVKIFLA